MSESKKGRGCFFYGCLTLVLVVIVAIIALFFAGRFIVKKVINTYTSPTPVAVEPVRLSARDGDQAVKRLDDFTRLLQQKAANTPLEISSDELDYIVRNSKQGGQVREAIHLVITNDQIHAQLSLPMGVISPRWEGRFFNGDATFGVAVLAGSIVVTPTSVEFNGQKLSDQIVSRISGQGSLRWPPAGQHPPGSEFLTNLSRVEIKGDKIVLHPK